jgi:NAD(P)H-hydrate epimerase
MIPLYSTKQIRKVDDYAINKLGLPGMVLMENASREIYRNIVTHCQFSSIGIICGNGNNGGDGFALARHFVNAGYKVVVVYLGPVSKMSTDCRMNYSVLKKMEHSHRNLSITKYKSIRSLSALKQCNLICDALLGSGAKGKLREPYLSIINTLNKTKKIKVAIDIPTGLDVDKGYSEDIFSADMTITLGGYKSGLFFGDGYLHAGEIKKGSIGISESYLESLITAEYLIEPEDALAGLPQKKKNIHKYSAGKVLNIAGSESYPGAAVLTSKSAFKIGAGASVLAFPKSVRNLVQKKLGEVVVHPYLDNETGYLLPENINDLAENIKWADVLIIGPGIGRDEKTQRAVNFILKARKFSRVVIDADAVFAIRKNRYKKLNLKNIVLTPHQGEFSDLIGISSKALQMDILKYGRSFVKKTGAYLVLKGAPTIIFTPNGDALINSSGNPALAKFGTGDVLSGMIAGLLAQQSNIEKAVVAAVYIHGLAADLLLKSKTEYSIMASDLINYIPNAINFLRKSFV